MVTNVKLRPAVLLLLLSMIAISCKPVATTTAQDQSLVATVVAATFQALTLQSPLQTSVLPSNTLVMSALAPTDQKTPIPSETATPSVTTTPGVGALSGGVYGYPYGTIPRLVFIAFREGDGHWYYWINLAGMSYYSTDEFLPTGRYQVVAYDSSGHAGGCVSIVEVKNNETAVCDITDWIGSYPGKPGDAPNP
jgi:hypothetical protein